VFGVVVAGIVAIGLIGGAVAARNLDERLTADQARLAQTLGRVDATMAQAVTTIGNAGTTLSTTSETLGSAADVLGRVADTSVDARTFEDKAGQLAANLAVNSSDTGGLADRVDELRGEVTSLETRVEAFEATGEIVSLLVGGILLLGLLVAWLAIAGAACAWVGLRLRRLGLEVAEAAAEPAAPGPI
jgi:hypothetical protein